MAFLKKQNYLLSEKLPFMQVVAGENIMSKKLLSESTIRRFAALSGIKADVVSNFINESDWTETVEETVNEEEEVEAEVEDADEADEFEAEADEIEDMEEPEAEEDAVLDMMDVEDEAGGEEGAESLVKSIVDQLQQLAQMAGVEIDVEEPEGDEMEMDLAEDTLEEIVDGILSEEAEEETLEEAAEEETLEEAAEEEALEEKEKKEKPEEERESYGSKARKRMADRPRGSATIRREGEHEDEEEAPAKRDYMQEELVQEVLKRVKERLAQLSQEQ